MKLKKLNWSKSNDAGDKHYLSIGKHTIGYSLNIYFRIERNMKYKVFDLYWGKMCVTDHNEKIGEIYLGNYKTDDEAKQAVHDLLTEFVGVLCDVDPYKIPAIERTSFNPPHNNGFVDDDTSRPRIVKIHIQ